MNNYEDIIKMQRPKSKYSQMSMEQRAAQFAPFASLTGFEESVLETERTTNSKIDLEDDTINELNYKIQIIKDRIKELPEVTILYFIKDDKKSGGKYETITEKVIKIDEYKQEIIFQNKQTIKFNDIIDISL